MSKNTSFLGAVDRFLLYDREEAGLPPNGGGKPLTVTDAGSLIPHEDKLLIFRALTGIETVPALWASANSIRSAPNLGIYSRVCKAEKAAARSYRLFSLLVNLFLGVQIVVAAILTSLGAANGPSNAVTAFGAINTIIAGAMTYLKGSGLPQRHKYHENEWKVVREYIEQREREFCLASCPLDVHEELIFVEEMYKRVKAELEASASGGSHGSSFSDRRHKSAIPSKKADAIGVDGNIDNRQAAAQTGPAADIETQPQAKPTTEKETVVTTAAPTSGDRPGPKPVEERTTTSAPTVAATPTPAPASATTAPTTEKVPDGR